MAQATPGPSKAYIPVSQTDEVTRSAFLVKVYQHLVLAVAAFIAVEAVLFTTGAAEAILNVLYRSGGIGWLAFMGGFMVLGNVAASRAHDLTSSRAQYAGLFGYALLEAVIFAPFLYLVFSQEGGTTTVGMAAVITIAGFAVLTVVAFTTRKDLSFLRPLIIWASVAALALIVVGALFNFELGVMFSVAMVALAGATILYQTQTILRQYPEWAYVGAAASLFASLMMLFWYVLRILSRR
ncbi:MAG: Bax inhibitor-1 family protein [Acidimicrobiales bacterium]